MPKTVHRGCSRSEGVATRRSEMRRAAERFFLIVMTLFAAGCYFDVSTESNRTGDARTAEELAGLVALQFAMQVNGATVDVDCPRGLSGEAGRQVTCNGTTSDGHALEIAVLEREEGAFRWDVVNSVPVATAKSRIHDAPETGTAVATQVDPKTGRRCQTNEFGYICTEN